MKTKKVFFNKIFTEIENNINKLAVIRQKGESQNGGNKKAKHPKFSENKHFLPPDMHT